jgi:uncharacterized protein
MPVFMYTVSIPIFIRHLSGLNTVLDKAAAWAAARKVNEADFLNMRLSPDMFNLARQVRAATDHAANAAARLAGKGLLKLANDETTIAQLKDRIGKTIEYLKGVRPSEIDGTEDKDITITLANGQTRQFTGQSLLLGNSLPNFWFHTTTAYDIVDRRVRHAWFGSGNSAKLRRECAAAIVSSNSDARNARSCSTWRAWRGHSPNTSHPQRCGSFGVGAFSPGDA